MNPACFVLEPPEALGPDLLLALMNKRAPVHIDVQQHQILVVALSPVGSRRGTSRGSSA